MCVCIYMCVCVCVCVYLYHTSSLMHQDGSTVMFPLGSQGVLGLAASHPLAQMTQLALILHQLPSGQLNCVSCTQDK